ncbi:MAG: lysophospholipid acyltransferase family protein [Longimicrobiales bacterium]
MSGWKEELRYKAVGGLGGRFLTGLFATTRMSRSGLDAVSAVHAEGRRVVYAFWHDQMLPLVRFHRNEGAVVLVSEHGDGEYIARVLDAQGFRTARGSSTRGGARGLRSLVRAAREGRGRDLAVTPDGPRGPRHRFKEGVLVASQLTGYPVVPIGVAAHPAWRLDSWDRFMVPKPFSRIHAVYGEPVPVPRDADESERKMLSSRLEEALERLTRRATDRVTNTGAEESEESRAATP